MARSRVCAWPRLRRHPRLEDEAVWAFDMQVVGEGGRASPYCAADAAGLTLAVPLRGRWTEDGRLLRDEGLTLACTSGAAGKCLAWGYAPWRAPVAGRSMSDYLQACTRLVRADYCGTGHSGTRDGIQIAHTGGLHPDPPCPTIAVRGGLGSGGRPVRAPRARAVSAGHGCAANAVPGPAATILARRPLRAGRGRRLAGQRLLAGSLTVAPRHASAKHLQPSFWTAL